jgi:hypothetical protein
VTIVSEAFVKKFSGGENLLDVASTSMTVGSL